MTFLRERSGEKKQAFCHAFSCAALKQVFPHLPSDVAEGHKYCVSRHFLVHVMPVDTFTEVLREWQRALGYQIS